MAVSTAACVSAGGTWKTPKPSCGMVRPSFRVMSGTAEAMLLLVLVRDAVPEACTQGSARSTRFAAHAAVMGETRLHASSPAAPDRQREPGQRDHALRPGALQLDRRLHRAVFRVCDRGRRR